MNFIILGDKFQKGMKSKGCAGLIKIAGEQNIFDQQYKIITKYFPSAHIIYIGGFESKKIENFIHKNYSNVVFINNLRFEDTNDCYSLSLISDFLIDDCFITFGYSTLNKKLFEKFDMSLGSQIFLTNNITSIGCIIQNNRVENISFDLPNHMDDLYYISSKDIHYLKNIAMNKQYHNYFIFELLNNLIDSKQISVTPLYYTSKHKTYEYSK